MPLQGLYGKMGCSVGYSGVRAFVTLLSLTLILFAVVVSSAATEGIPPALAEKRVEARKGMVAFVDMKSEEPTTLYIMYPTQYSRYKETGSTEGALEFKDLTWLLYPVAAMLEDQTVYFVPKGEARFDVRYENIQERIDQLLRGEEKLRAGMEMQIEEGVSMIRLTPLIPALKVRLDFSGDTRFVILKTIDFARYRKGLKTFEQLYDEAVLRGSEKEIHFSTTDFEDLYLLVKTDGPLRVRSIIHATKESAESGC